MGRNAEGGKQKLDNPYSRGNLPPQTSRVSCRRRLDSADRRFSGIVASGIELRSGDRWLSSSEGPRIGRQATPPLSSPRLYSKERGERGRSSGPLTSVALVARRIAGERVRSQLSDSARLAAPASATDPTAPLHLPFGPPALPKKPAPSLRSPASVCIWLGSEGSV